jgi:hypothetical protein
MVSGWSQVHTSRVRVRPTYGQTIMPVSLKLSKNKPNLSDMQTSQICRETSESGNRSSVSDVERAIASAKSWVAEQGWAVDNFFIASSELQSCPIGYVTIDVICCQTDNADQFHDSRVLEVHLSTGKVENVLASRNPEQLKKVMDLERVKVITERMQQKLDEPQGEHAQEREGDMDDMDFRKLLFEEVCFLPAQSFI